MYPAPSTWVTVFSPPGHSQYWEGPGYQHAALVREHVEVRLTLPGEVLHGVAFWS